MAESTDELRAQLDRQRESIGQTVGQIENRVRPDRILARRRDRARQRVTNLKDRVMGNDEPDYRMGASWMQTGAYARQGGGYEYDDSSGGMRDQLGGAADSARDRASQVGDAVSDAPTMMRRQTRGNPAAAGLMAFGAGMLVATLLPESRREQEAARRIQPQLESAASGVVEKGQEVAEDMKEPAQQAAQDVKDSATRKGQELKGEASQAAQRTKDDATS